MSYNMNTKFIDNKSGEEFEFLGTSISYSEKELLALEEEHDKKCKLVIEELMNDGYFEEEWTDYYANTDDEDEDNDYNEDVEEDLDVEYEENEEIFNNKENKCTKSSQLNVPLFIAPKNMNNSFQYQLPLRCITKNVHSLTINININGIRMEMITIIN